MKTKIKTKKIELDVDFIGGQGSLTPSEEKALSDFFRQRKLSNRRNIVIEKANLTKQTN